MTMMMMNAMVLYSPDHFMSLQEPHPNLNLSQIMKANVFFTQLPLFWRSLASFLSIPTLYTVIYVLTALFHHQNNFCLIKSNF